MRLFLLPSKHHKLVIMFQDNSRKINLFSTWKKIQYIWNELRTTVFSCCSWDHRIQSGHSLGQRTKLFPNKFELFQTWYFICFYCLESYWYLWQVSPITQTSVSWLHWRQGSKPSHTSANFLMFFSLLYLFQALAFLLIILFAFFVRFGSVFSRWHGSSFSQLIGGLS